MDFDSIWTAYYSQFRADADIPISTEDEYTIGVRLANEAINRWAQYDNTYWRELFETNQTDGTGDLLIVDGQTAYDAPTNFKEAGGYVWILDADGKKVQKYPIIENHEAQFKNDNSSYCYFTGNPKDGYVLHLNPAPTTNLVGLRIEYIYYKTPTLFTIGSSKTEMADPYFVVHRMLASQFRASRNPYYSSAKSDAENALRQMQLANNSGSWANPWSETDNSGTSWGQ